jgi:Rab GDP dissociation inhibitor
VVGDDALHCRDGCYISKGYDPTTHFETTVDDVLELYKRITGGEVSCTSLIL